jgi:hypothetical protein
MVATRQGKHWQRVEGLAVDASGWEDGEGEEGKDGVD